VSRVGISFRWALASWLERSPPEVACLEIVAEHFIKAGGGYLRSLADRYPLLVHTERLSVGTPGPLDGGELTALAALVRELKPLWVSDHLGFRRTREVDLGSPVPMLLNNRTLALVAERVQRMTDACQVPLLLENLSSPLALHGTLSEPEFLNRLCARTGCGVLLDAAALLVNSRNHGFDALAWLQALDPAYIVQVHVGGCRESDGRGENVHDDAVPEEVWEFLAEVLKRGSIEALVLERDAGFPAPEDLAQELRRMRTLAGAGSRIGVDA
jgi:hypothetical protein